MNTETNPQIDQSRYNTMVVLYINGQPIRILTPIAPLAYYPRSERLKISFAPLSPGRIAPVIYLHEGLTIGEIAKAIGLKSYDCALPYQWVVSEFLSKGLEFPRGAWSYDERRSCGEFLSLDDMFSRLGQRIAELIGYDGLTMLDHGWDFDPTWYEPRPGDLVTLRIGGIDHPGGARVIEVISRGTILAENTQGYQSTSALVCLGGSTYMYHDEMIAMLKCSDLRVRLAPVATLEEINRDGLLTSF